VEVSITLGLAGFAETLSEFELQTAGIEGTPAPSFALGLHHRFRRLDLGVGVEHRPGQPVLLEHARKSPGQLIGNLHLGWRMFEGHRGALYSRVALGGFFAMPDDGFRASVAHHFTDVPDFEAVDERFAGISTSAHFGGVLYYGDGLGFFVEMANYLSFGLFHLDNTEMTYEANEVALNAGATWSL